MMVGDISINSPEFASRAQVEYIRDFYHDFEDAAFSVTGFNDKGKHFTEYLDLESAAKTFLIHEFSKNHDGGASSFYIWKPSDSDSDGKMRFGPVWDLDNSFGNGSSWWNYLNMDLSDPEGFWMSKSIQRYGTYVIYAGLFQHQEFHDALLDCWDEFADAVEILLGNKPSDDDSYSLKSIAEYEEMVASSAEMNYQIREKIIFHPEGKGNDYTELRQGAYSNGIDYIRQFAEKRFEFLTDIFTRMKNGEIFLEELPEPPVIQTEHFEMPPEGDTPVYYYNSEGWSSVIGIWIVEMFDGGGWSGYNMNTRKDLHNGWWEFYPPSLEDEIKIAFINEFSMGEDYTSTKIVTGEKVYFWGDMSNDGGEDAPGHTYEEAVAKWGHAPKNDAD
jgi:hypothetical protein